MNHLASQTSELRDKGVAEVFFGVQPFLGETPDAHGQRGDLLLKGRLPAQVALSVYSQHTSGGSSSGFFVVVNKSGKKGGHAAKDVFSIERYRCKCGPHDMQEGSPRGVQGESNSYQQECWPRCVAG